MEKVAEQYILQKCSKCSRFGVMSTLLKVATIAITHLAMDLGLKIPSMLFFGCIKVQLHTYGSHLNQRKKTHGRTPEEKTMAAILLTPVAAILFFRISRKRFPGKFSNDEFILQSWKL